MGLNYADIEKVVRVQEETLVFDHFTNRDAWELGQFMVNKVYEQGIELAITIRKLNGNIIFQHLTEKTNLLNQNWMNRKFNTVSMMERSSFGAWAESFVKGEDLKTHALDEKDFALCGGGFPARLKTGEMAGIIIVSNLPHEKDHAFIVDCLKEWLDHPEVPTVSFE